MRLRSAWTAGSGWRRAKLRYFELLDPLADAAREAGEAILAVVRRGFEIEAKRDSSPVTEADRAAELIILAALARAAPGVPVIAEEEVAAGRIPAHDRCDRRASRRGPLDRRSDRGVRIRRAARDSRRQRQARSFQAVRHRRRFDESFCTTRAVGARRELVAVPGYRGLYAGPDGSRSDGLLAAKNAMQRMSAR